MPSCLYLYPLFLTYRVKCQILPVVLFFDSYSMLQDVDLNFVTESLSPLQSVKLKSPESACTQLITNHNGHYLFPILQEKAIPEKFEYIK